MTTARSTFAHVEQEPVHFRGTRETLFATLYGKAVASRAPDPIITDPLAVDAVRHLDYDFRRNTKITRQRAQSVAIRAKTFDQITEEILARTPETTVLHLGCGLDSRAFRVSVPALSRWYDVDFPDVTELRRRLFPEPTGYHLIGSSVNDPQWMIEVPTDQAVLVLAEGLSMYLRESEILALLGRIVRRFPAGEIAFDAFSRLGLRLGRLDPTIRAAGATLRWGIDDHHELERSGVTFVEERAYFDLPEIAKLSWPTRIMCRALGRIPAARRVGRILVYRF